MPGGNGKFRRADLQIRTGPDIEPELSAILFHRAPHDCCGFYSES